MCKKIVPEKGICVFYQWIVCVYSIYLAINVFFFTLCIFETYDCEFWAGDLVSPYNKTCNYLNKNKKMFL